MVGDEIYLERGRERGREGMTRVLGQAVKERKKKKDGKHLQRGSTVHRRKSSVSRII